MFWIYPNTSNHSPLIEIHNFYPTAMLKYSTLYIHLIFQYIYFNGINSRISPMDPLFKFNSSARVAHRTQEKFTYSYQLIIKWPDIGYKWISRQKRWTGQGLQKECGASLPFSSTALPASPHFHHLRSSWDPTILRFYDWFNHWPLATEPNLQPLSPPWNSRSSRKRLEAPTP